jgi:small subunit ribosomal protein S6
MNKYEAMFILKPDLPEEEKKTLFNQIGEAITKNQGALTQAAVWAEKRKLCFPIKKCHDGMYYLVNFTIPPSGISRLREIYKLNENIIRVLISA